MVPGYDWWNSHTRQAFPRRVWARVQPSRGEPLGELQDVRPLVNPFLAFFLMFCLAHSPIDDNHATFPAGAETVTFVGRPFSLDEAPQHLARLRRWGLTFGELSLLCVSAFLCSYLPPLFAPLRIKSVSSSLGRLLSTRARMSSIVLLPSSVSAKFHCAHTGASMMLLTSPTSAQFSRYSRSLASPPLSHYTKTSGHATPAGPAHRLGRSSM